MLSKAHQKIACLPLHGVLLSESAAKKYFGDSNPVGKVLNITTMGAFYSMNVCGIL